jgi:hypothetical protein
MNVQVVVYWRGLYEVFNMMFGPWRRRFVNVGRVSTATQAIELTDRVEQALTHEFHERTGKSDHCIVSTGYGVKNTSIELSMYAWSVLEPGLGSLVADIYTKFADEFGLNKE